jgi:hypothetical protein
MTCCDRMDELIEAGYAYLDPTKHKTSKLLIIFADTAFKNSAELEVKFGFVLFVGPSILYLSLPVRPLMSQVCRYCK